MEGVSDELCMNEKWMDGQMDPWKNKETAKWMDVHG